MSCKKQRTPIPLLKGSSMRLIHPTTLETPELALNTAPKIDSSTAYCHIKPDTLLCCGGANPYDCHNEVYEVSIRTGEVRVAPSMKPLGTGRGLMH